MNILKLIAQLTLDGRGFKAGLKEAEASSKRFASDLGSAVKGQLAAAFGTAAIAAFAKTSLDFVGGLKDMAEQSHMTTDEVQKLSAAAEHMGMTFGDVMNAERQFNAHRKEAVETNMALREVFARYGVTLDDLQNPQFKFVEFLQRANKAMREMSPQEMQLGLNDMAELLGNRIGPKLQEFIKQLHSVADMKLISEKTIDDTDRKLDKWGDMVRAMKGNFAEGIQTWPTPGNLLKAMGFGGGVIPSPFSAASGMAGGALLDVKKPSSLYSKTAEQAAAEKASVALTKQRAELEEAIYKVHLQQMSAADQRIEKEKKLAKATEEILDLEALGWDATRQRTDAVKLLGDLLDDKNEESSKESAFAMPSVSSLTQVGQWGGRSFVNSTESELPRTVKAINANTQKIKEVLLEINPKVGKGNLEGIL